MNFGNASADALNFFPTSLLISDNLSPLQNLMTSDVSIVSYMCVLWLSQGKHPKLICSIFQTFRTLHFPRKDMDILKLPNILIRKYAPILHLCKIFMNT